ncbi:glycoside hydrolase superfamily [Butyriboletus roseoflavus]|nr:glycoside hydrolase superfamily [Butyriboletus roseoflavus]
MDSLPIPDARQSAGFVKIDGQGFTLNGMPYRDTVLVPCLLYKTRFRARFNSANSYWVLMGLTADEMNVTFHSIAATGGTTVRAWQVFPYERNATLLTSETCQGLQRGHRLQAGSTTSSGTEARLRSNWSRELWSDCSAFSCVGQIPHVAFQDNVIAAAKANDVRLIVTLTNNWGDYGGMDVYGDKFSVKGQPHDLSLHQPQSHRCIYQNLDREVSRRTNHPWIFPHLTYSYSKRAPLHVLYQCHVWNMHDPPPSPTWVKTMSAYIKSLDRNHLVAVGDEGWFNWTNNLDPSYNGSQGIDFGTFHLYPYSLDDLGKYAPPTVVIYDMEPRYVAQLKARNRLGN